MTVVDASVWVSALSPGEIDHETSRIWLRAQSETGLTIPVLALAETAGAIARRTRSSQDGHAAYATLMATPRLRIVTVDAGLGREAAELAATHRLRGADATYVAVARLLSLPLATLDREMKERASSVVEIIDPAQPAPREQTEPGTEPDVEAGN